MPIPVVVPRLGWTMEQGVFVEWLKRDGDTIRIGDPIFVLEGEKATQDIESTDAGVLKILSTGPRGGDTIDVGATVGYLLAEGEVWDGTPGAAPAPTLAAAAEIPATEVDEDEPVVESNAGAGTSRQRITPRARRVAGELGVDWADIDGTGAEGRIREADIRAAADESVSIPMVANTPAMPAVELTAVAASNARRTIADRMLASAQQTAAVTLTTHVDATHLVALRKQFKSAAGDPSEVVPSLTDILVKLTAVALKMHPEVNSRWDDERILTSDEVHIGIAVDTPQALLVPVLRSVTRLTLRQVAVRSRDLIERARTRKIAVAELQGGTFTVTNLGMFGVDAFTPLLNPPQAAILGVGRITREAAVIDEHIVPRDRLTLSLTFDHRIIDGAPAARFLDSLSRLISNPAPALIV
ncbi:MAG: 2-oxo acid dehydrogenase subunit [Planctomycetaceae bacterium]|nr:2-oxo acid dehydrogenase subunit [Planctomycetaceae bacterium]